MVKVVDREIFVFCKFIPRLMGAYFLGKMVEMASTKQETI
jgi:hypothetical protein